MSDVIHLNFAGANDAKAKLRSAMAYLLKGTTGIDRDLMALEIIEILRQVGNGLPPRQLDPFADELPGG